ncbi:hypothetical protein [Xanthomarina gelatinilytica]|uniref:hypothetical protein n=1 Tax=Xanthomarina gelatinilytica TaxID=1137281 RepID=UPI003AA93CD5
MIKKKLNLLFNKLKGRIVFISIIAENFLRTLTVLVVLNLFSSKELSSLGIIQAAIAIFTILLPLGFGVSSQRFSVDIKSKEFLGANTLFYLISFIQMLAIYFLWNFFIYKIEGLDFDNSYYKLVFLAITFLTIERTKIKAILRIRGENNLFIMLSIIPAVLEIVLVYFLLNNNSGVFDLFIIRIISTMPVLIFTFYSFRYLTINFYDKTVVKYSLITIPNKLVTGSLGYFMNLFAFNLGTDFMAKFYGSLKITSILNTILNAYYQYVEPTFYRKEGIAKKLHLRLIRNICILSLLFMAAVFVLMTFFGNYPITNNLSIKIIALLSVVYILTMIFRFVSFKLFFHLRNDLIFYINILAIVVFMLISYSYPKMFLEALILGLTIKILSTLVLNNKYFKLNE